MNQIHALRIFITVADHASFSEAARRMRISAATATRAVAFLETALGVSLFHRTTRSVRLTEAGANYLERCRAALAELDDAAHELGGEISAPRGQIVLSAPVSFGRLHVLPVVSSLLRAHPLLKVQLTLVDRVVRLVDEGIDVAVRIGDLSDSALHARKVGHVRRIIVASPDYLERNGTPQSIRELSNHPIISFAEIDRAHEWRFGPSGKTALKIEPTLLVNTAEAAVDAVSSGLGIARVLSYQASEAIRSGRMVRLFDDLSPPPLPVHLVHQAKRRASVNVRAFVGAAQRYFAGLNLCDP